MCAQSEDEDGGAAEPVTEGKNKSILQMKLRRVVVLIGKAGTSMHSLTFRLRVTTPHTTDETERRTQQARRFYRRRGESSPGMHSVRVRHACGVRWAWRITAGLCRAFP